MSIATPDLVFEDFAHLARRASSSRTAGAVSTGQAKPTLRLALLYREELRIPASSDWLLRILSGKAWVSFAGEDFELGRGDSLPVPQVKHGAIISAIGGEALLFEIT